MKAIGVVFVTLLAATVTMAQTKISGTVQCGKADQQQSMDVGDKPNHSLGLAQGKCTWTKPMDIEGGKSKDDVYAVSSDVSGDTHRDQGYVTDTMDSGDKYVVRIQGTANWKDGKPVSEHGTWSFASGTGKLKGIKGKGTYNGKADGDNMVITVEGEYELAKK